MTPQRNIGSRPGFIFFLGVAWALMLTPEGAQVVENPSEPLAENAGRVLELVERMRIRDGQGFFFQTPLDVKIAPDGSIFVQEYKKLYRFDAAGKFLGNLYKKGEGPGELNDNLNGVLPRVEDLILFSSNMNKVIRMTYEGGLIEEFRPRQTYFTLVGYRDGRYFLAKARYPMRDRKSGLKSQGMEIFTEDGQGGVRPLELDFPTLISIYYGERSVGIMSITRLMCFHAPGNEVFLLHTPEYLIKRLDLAEERVTKSFRRDYPRLKTITKSERGPLPEFQNDIYRLLLPDGAVWVVTSTFDPDKGLLTDVFDREGRYRDNFYLPIPGAKRGDWIYAPMALSDGHLFVIERDEDELYSVVKYAVPELRR